MTASVLFQTKRHATLVMSYVLACKLSCSVIARANETASHTLIYPQTAWNFNLICSSQSAENVESFDDVCEQIISQLENNPDTPCGN